MVKCKYIAYHVFINFITVIVCNNALLSTICQDQILSCCDPMNSLWFKLPAHLGPCAWLIGHTIGYFHAAYCWAGSCWKCHLTLIMCQFIWALSETVIFQGVHDSDNLLTCNHEIVYPSTWQPIWQDFIYNSIGHLGGFILYNFYCHKVIGLIWKIKEKENTSFINIFILLCIWYYKTLYILLKFSFIMLMLAWFLHSLFFYTTHFYFLIGYF